MNELYAPKPVCAATRHGQDTGVSGCARRPYVLYSMVSYGLIVSDVERTPQYRDISLVQAVALEQRRPETICVRHATVECDKNGDGERHELVDLLCMVSRHCGGSQRTQPSIGRGRAFLRVYAALQ